MNHPESPAPDEEGDGREEMPEPREPLLAVHEEREERGLEEEREEPLHRERVADHVARVAREARPVRPELELHRDAGHDADREVDPEDADPEAGGVVPALAARAQGERLHDDDQEREAHREDREQVVEQDREGELEPVEEERIAHRVSWPESSRLRGAAAAPRVAARLRTVAMREELSRIDLTPLADLVTIKQEEELLAERLLKIEERAGKVSPAVYDRVKHDYEARRLALEEQSRPLKERARTEFRRLEGLRAQAAQAVQAATLELEELELRNDLGEFADDAYRERLAACDARLTGEKQGLEDVEETRARFLEAFHTEDELAGGAEPPPSPPARPAPAIYGSALDPEGPDATLVKAPAAGPEPPAWGREPTHVLPRARLALLDGEAVAREFPVKPGISTIGRLPQSDIHLPTPDVSRRHAQLVFGEDGCTIVDLGSENGVVVNGARIARHLLVDGDVVQLGKQRLRFLA